MADIELVIKVDEEVYKKAQETHDVLCDSVWLGIKNGKPLPKGHGRLIDADTELEGLRKMKVVDEKDKQSVRFAILEYENAPTIIEADKADKGVEE